MNVLVFGFRGTIAEKVAKELHDTADVKIIASSEQNVERFISETDFSAYDYIIGMGSYSGHDKDKVRVEASCSNQFRNDKTRLRKLEIPYFIEPKGIFKFARGIGNSWCNLVSYALLSKNPDIQYTFLHIPKSQSYKTVADEVRKVLLQLA